MAEGHTIETYCRAPHNRNIWPYNSQAAAPPSRLADSFVCAGAVSIPTTYVTSRLSVIIKLSTFRLIRHINILIAKNTDAGLFRSICSNPDHVLRHYFTDKSPIGQNLRPRAHSFALPSKDPRNFVSRTLCGALLNRKQYTNLTIYAIGLLKFSGLFAWTYIFF